MSCFGLKWFAESGEREFHENGTVTERYSDGTSETYKPELNPFKPDTVLERTAHETNFFGTKFTVTYNGDGKEINRQREED